MSAEFWAIIGMGILLMFVIGDAVKTIVHKLSILIDVTNDIRVNGGYTDRR